METGTLEESDIIPNISRAIAGSRLCPVFAVSSLTLVGLPQLLDGVLDYAPAPDTHENEHGKASLDEGAAEVTRGYHAEEPFSAYVFRTIADPFAGRINVMKIIIGSRQVGRQRPEHDARRGRAPGRPALDAGQAARQGRRGQRGRHHRLSSSSRRRRPATRSRTRPRSVVYDPIEYPEAAISFAIEPKSRQDEEKISASRSTRFSKKTPRSTSRATRRPRSSSSPGRASSTSRPWSRS